MSKCPFMDDSTSTACPLNQTFSRYSLTAEIASAVHMRLIPWLFGIVMATVCFAFVAFVTR